MGSILLLEDGSLFSGESFGMKGEIIGELVFNTGMTGYQEILTDPSYCGQLVTMTYPLIGNYGINYRDMESERPHLSGFIVREHCREYSNFRAKSSLEYFLRENGVIGISGLDTRALTKKIRENGTMKAMISNDSFLNINLKIQRIKEWEPENLVGQVSRKGIENIGRNEDCTSEGLKNEYKPTFKVALIDYGLKKNILRELLRHNCNVTIFPYDAKASEILGIDPDGIMLSNGPGDPKDCKEQIETLKTLMGKKPIFGICLGHQLLALSQGANTEKLKYGHRGCNHPVKDLKKDRTYITSQNHGYTIVENSIGKEEMEISHINLNDNSIEGIRYLKYKAFTVQFHPEASPGPRETGYLFDEFIELMKTEREGGSI
jgi:carbamoyl-phosphate synthase small subunit